VLGEARRFAEAFSDEVRFVDAVVDGHSHCAVLGAAATRPAASGDKARARALLVAQAAGDGPTALDRGQQHRLLSDASALAQLRERVMLRQAHPAWWQVAEPASTAQPAARPTADEHYAGQPGVALGG
jgi:membrane glycosyltransferase